MTTAQAGIVLRHIRGLAAAAATTELADRQLLERFAAQREGGAFDGLVRRHGPMVLGVCRRVLGSRHDAEDAFQATFLVLALKAGTIARRDSVGGWLYQVAYHMALKAKASMAARQRRELTVGERGATATGGYADPLAEVTGRELLAVLDEELHRLPDRYRTPLVLCYLEGKSRDEAACQLGTTLATLKRRLAQGRERLRARLECRGVALSAALAALCLTSAAVPQALAATTAHAARLAVSGCSMAVTSSVAHLAADFLRGMSIGKWKILAGVLVFVGIIAGGWLSHATPTDQPRAAAQSPEKEVRPAVSDESKSMTVSGRVFMPDGKPAAGANVAIVARQGVLLSSNEWWASFRNEVLGQVKTDKEGKYRVRVPRSDALMNVRAVRAVATAGRYGLAWKALNPDAEQAEADLRLTPVQRVSGHIVGLQGEDAAGVTIHVARITRKPEKGERDEDAALRPPESLPLSATTDDKGNFVFHGFGPNLTLELEVLDPRYERKEEWFVNTADKKQCENMRLLLAPGRYIEGRVIYQDTGKPVPHAKLMIVNPIIETHADAGGRFTVPLYLPKDDEKFAARPRDVSISAWPPPGQPYLGDSKGVDFPKGVVKREVLLAFSRAALIRGKITEDGSGKPVAGARVAYSAGYDHSVASGADGAYQIAAQPGGGRLIVTHPSGEFISQIVGSAGGGLDKPIGDPSYHHAVIDLDVKKDEKVKEVNVALRRGVTIKGRLLGPEDKPVSSAIMFVSAHRPRRENTMHPVEVRDGHFEVRGCDPEKTYELLFLEYPGSPRPLMMAEGLQTFGQLWMAELINGKDKRGASVKVLAKKAAGEPLVVRVAPCGSAKLRFVDAAGKPKADFIPWLQLVVTPGPPLWKASEEKTLAAEVVSLAGPYGDQPPGQPKTDDKGYVTYHGLIPGATYRIKTYHRDMIPNIVLKDFTVEAGKTAEFDVVVK